MKFPAARRGLKSLCIDFLFYGLWTALVIVGLILQVVPVLLMVGLCSLAFGAPPRAALTVVPVVFIAMLAVACMIASKLARRSFARLETERPVERYRTVPRIPLRDNVASPADYYRDLKRLG